MLVGLMKGTGGNETEDFNGIWNWRSAGIGSRERDSFLCEAFYVSVQWVIVKLNCTRWGSANM